MKQLRFVTSPEQAAYMRERQRQNQVKTLSSAAENWAAARLKQTGHKWKRQTVWGYRIFDFHSHALGCSVEIDGPGHDAAYDAYRDEYNFRRSGIVVLRVRNFCAEDMERVCRIIGKLNTWPERRAELGLNVSGRRARRHLSSRPYEAAAMLADYLRAVEQGRAWKRPTFDLFDLVPEE